MTHNDAGKDDYGLDMKQSKFSMVDEDRGEQTYVRLVKFAYWLAGNNQNQDSIMMSFDEIVGELLLELAKGLQHYEDLPDDELDAVIRRMMDNRISELKYKYYKTHRKYELEKVVLSWDECSEWENSTGHGSDTENITESKRRVQDTRNGLSPVSKEVFDALVFGNDRLNNQLKLSNMRANTVYKNHKVRVRPHHVADALLISEKQVIDSYNEIREVYQEVCRAGRSRIV
jgi:DNA-directed RNA polymerase specialized sigma24 family protein